MSELIVGKFSDLEDKFIIENYLHLTDAQLAEKLNRNIKSIRNRKLKIGANDKNGGQKSLGIENRESYVSKLDDNDKKEFFIKELRVSSTYGQIKEVLTQKEIKYYEEKYVDFMLDPSIETMTSMEKDSLHQMTMAQIRIFRYMAEEKRSQDEVDDFLRSGKRGDMPKLITRSTQIRECEEIVQKCQESLSVQRKQRLSNKSDQAVNFSNLIKELKDPSLRREIGYEAAMLKYIGEKTYNDALGKNIISGSNHMFDIGRNFIDGTVPSGLHSDFFGNKK